MKHNFKFNCGDIVKDKITGFNGVVVARIQYLTGCNRYSIQSRILADEKPVEWQNFDEDQLNILKEDIIKIQTDRSKGGVKPKVTSSKY